MISSLARSFSLLAKQSKYPYYSWLKSRKYLSTTSCVFGKKKSQRVLKLVGDLDRNVEKEVLEDDEYKHLVNREIHSVKGSTSVAVIQPWIKWGRKKRRDTYPELLLDEAVALVNSIPDMNVKYKVIILSIIIHIKLEIFKTG